jgi:2-furoate---CoA ligase
MFDLGRTFLQSVERSPDALALVDGDIEWTYAQWFEQIRRAMHMLCSLDIERGDKVITVLQNRWEAATLHWVCQLLGVTMVPINWRVKAEELEYNVIDAEVKAVFYEPVSEDAVIGSPAAHGVILIGLDNARGSTFDFSDLLTRSVIDVVVTPEATAEDTSVMLYTSGTTGMGKGVPRRHRQERAAALAHVAQNLYRNGEKTLGVMPLYHTMGVRSLLAMALVDGLFVCVRRWNVAQAIDMIAKYRLTCLYLVPTLYHDMLAAPQFNHEAVRSVRKLGFAGAPMNDGLLKRCTAAFNPELFVNHYGSSEVYTCSIEQDASARPGSAGRAGLNTRLRVVTLDADGPTDMAKRGDEGQVIVELAGDEAFEGYWKRPDADAKSLRGGWYFTGDTGYIDASGYLYVTGRIDDMIISGGENISPVDIESVLSLHPAVDEVAVVGLKDERWGQKVVAFIRVSQAVSSIELDDYCRRSGLVNFKRPREYVFVEAIPKSPVGKILRRKLAGGEFVVAGEPAQAEVTADGAGVAAAS